ncbi:MAG: hypothetical protein JXA44_08750 [Methanospirillaceae archaeon]|nr:hypothetical protein [Methanospirillaceae archaeon]
MTGGRLQKPFIFFNRFHNTNPGKINDNIKKHDLVILLFGIPPRIPSSVVPRTRRRRKKMTKISDVTIQGPENTPISNSPYRKLCQGKITQTIR